MDDDEMDLSAQIMLSNSETPANLNDLLTNTTTTCTHTHTCNPPAPGPAAAAHTHTCFHTHTHVLTTDGDGGGGGGGGGDKPKAARNREAVRKYREKKKAHAARLEEEARRLRAINQQLLKRLRGQPALEAEAARLRALLVDARAKINGALASGSHQFGEDDALGPSCGDGSGTVQGVSQSCAAALLNCHGGAGSGQSLGTPL